jgi:hypothetical protein
VCLSIVIQTLLTSLPPWIQTTYEVVSIVFSIGLIVGGVFVVVAIYSEPMEDDHDEPM